MEELKSAYKEKSYFKSDFQQFFSEFQEFIDYIPEIVYELDINGKITFINQAGLDILGYSKEEFEKGIFVYDIIAPEDKDYFQRNFGKVIGANNRYKFEYRLVRKDGSVIPVLANGSPIIRDNKFVGSRGIILNLSDRKLAERKLKDAHDFLNTAINSMQEPFFVKDENHKWIILNDASIKMWGYSREELIGKSDYDIFPEKQAAVFWETDEFVLKNGSNTNIEEITNSEGEIRTIITTKVLYTDEITGEKFIVGTIHDITDLRSAELKLKKYSKELEELNKNKDKFFSIIAHDLRNPFTGIFGFSSVLLEEFDTLTKEEIREYVNYIYKGAKNIYDLIENLLTWSRIQTGRVIVQPVKLDLYNEVQDAINILKIIAETKKIKIINAVEKNIFASGDDNMVDSVLQNLISNAIKFTNVSGCIKISSSITDNFIEISISDDGVGMSGEEIDNLFQIGKQKSKTGTSEEKGTGLGLILCKEMINKLNGQLKVESEIDKGSTFSFTLPII
jgi:PAS domain S-box-containing protein